MDATEDVDGMTEETMNIYPRCVTNRREYEAKNVDEQSGNRGLEMSQ